MTALANAGVVVGLDGTQVIIDGLFRQGVAGYATLPPDLRADLERATGRFAGARLLLVTHWHADHFDPRALTARLAADPATRAVVADQVAGQMRGLAGVDPALLERVRVLTPAPGRRESVQVGGVEVLAVRLAHNPSRNFPDQHLGIGVRLGGRTVLHVGDADPTRENFRAAEPLAPVDVAIVPWWYLVSESGRAIVRDQLRARHVVVIHVEPARAGEIRREVGAARPGTVVLAAPLEKAVFGDTAGAGPPAGR